MRLVLVVLSLLLASCVSVPILSPYKIDIQQGNLVTQEMVSKLKPGMTKSQVRFILGTPLITDAFHADRWDYLYLYKKGGKLSEQRKLAAFFEDGKLTRIEGDIVAEASPKGLADPVLENQKTEPLQPQQPKSDAAQMGTDTKPQPETKPSSEEKGFFGRMLEKIGL